MFRFYDDIYDQNRMQPTVYYRPARRYPYRGVVAAEPYGYPYGYSHYYPHPMVMRPYVVSYPQMMTNHEDFNVEGIYVNDAVHSHPGPRNLIRAKQPQFGVTRKLRNDQAGYTFPPNVSAKNQAFWRSDSVDSQRSANKTVYDDQGKRRQRNERKNKSSSFNPSLQRGKINDNTENIEVGVALNNTDETTEAATNANVFQPCEPSMISPKETVDSVTVHSPLSSSEETLDNSYNIPSDQSVAMSSVTVEDVDEYDSDYDESIYSFYSKKDCFASDSDPVIVPIKTPEEQARELWSSELELLKSLGFQDEKMLLPLLETYIGTPTKPKQEVQAGMQQLMAYLLLQ